MNYENMKECTSVAFRLTKQAITRGQERTILSSQLGEIDQKWRGVMQRVAPEVIVRRLRYIGNTNGMVSNDINLT